MKPRVIDMFSGAGLFSGGLADAGFDPVFAIDLDPMAVGSFNRNVADVAHAGSVTQDWKIPTAELLVAGPPCQGFSTLGRQDPLDARNELSKHVAGWAEAANARLVIVENVPPFLRSSHWAAMKSQLEALGYDVMSWELDAHDFGVAQHRRRSFTIASKIGPLEAPKKIAGGLTAQVAFEPIDAGDAMHRWPTPSELAMRRMSVIPKGGDKRHIAAFPDLCPPSWGKMGCQATDVWGRMVTNRPANTLRCNFQNPSKGRYIHPTENRVISLREGARLQGVPDHWDFVGLPTQIARQIGNGVPVPLARAIGEQALAALAA